MIEWFVTEFINLLSDKLHQIVNQSDIRKKETTQSLGMRLFSYANSVLTSLVNLKSIFSIDLYTKFFKIGHIISLQICKINERSGTITIQYILDYPTLPGRAPFIHEYNIFFRYKFFL